MDYKSQINQDKYFIENINNNKKNGFFVDVGAHNGITFSNTYCLEKYLDWNGLCIEVNDDIFETLQNNRDCLCVNECVYEVSGIELELEIPLANEIPEGNDMLTRIKCINTHNFDTWHNQFIKTKNIKKITKTLTDIFEKYNVPQVIDYLSIDIEGAELIALKGLDFNKYIISFLTLEWQGGESKKPYLNSIKSFLNSKGYHLHRINQFDAEFHFVKSPINSFDVFDTLLARKTENPHGIFKIIETEFPFINFYNCRCTAEKYSNGTFDDIYKQFKILYNIDEEICNKLKEYELITEMKNSYLIETNYNRVKDGDILISDMYLNENDIMKILKYHGFNKKVKLYASSNGKSSKTIWPKLLEEYNINLHLGDNEHSDVNSPKLFGINAELTTIHRFSNTEQFFFNNKYSNFSLLIREFRHKNPYEINTNNYQLYNDQILFNIPFLIMYSQSLYEIMINENRTKLLLLTRDCCLLKYIFKLLYPSIECMELQSSRKIHKTPNDEYKNYLIGIYNPNSCLIADLYGAFESGRELYKELFWEYPRVHLFGYNKNTTINIKKYDKLTYLSLLCIENLNFDTIGSLYKLENNIFHRYPIIEYYVEDAEIYKNTVISFYEFMQNKNIPYILSLFNSFVDIIIIKCNVRVFANVYSFSHPSLLEIANVEKSDKGSIINCGHYYIDYYEELLKDFINNSKNISILEYGLNHYTSNCIPSYNLWNIIFRKKLYYVGFDKNKDFLKFNNNNNNIYIYNELSYCNNHKYDLIIDDESHSSQSQQFAFKTLWQSIKPGGIYCIESLHWQPFNDFGKKTKDLLLEWKNNNKITSEFINEDELNAIYPEISTIEFYPSKSSKWSEEIKKNAFCVIKKI
jgi:FkbM family methyltransferase